MREIHKFCANESTELMGVFRTYMTLKSIRGLHVEIHRNGVQGACLDVRDVYVRNVDTCHICLLGMKVSVKYHDGPDESPHFHIVLREELVECLWPNDYSPDLRMYTARFEIDDMIEFVHKSLHKRVPS